MSTVRAIAGLRALQAQSAPAPIAQVGQAAADAGTGISISTIALGLLGVGAVATAAYLYGQHRGEKKGESDAHRQLAFVRRERILQEAVNEREAYRLGAAGIGPTGEWEDNYGFPDEAPTVRQALTSPEYAERVRGNEAGRCPDGHDGSGERHKLPALEGKAFRVRPFRLETVRPSWPGRPYEQH